ncbi:MAG: hypothetical protein J7502_03215 [Flavisolibacter sp.]|nr:hypothetical protein [Flavisolibacter sp.]
MNKLRFTALICSATAIFFTSCGSNEQKNNANNSPADSTTHINNASTTSTVVTSPQDIMTATHRVADFAKWKASYDAHDSMRLASGLHNYVIGRSIEDSNMILVAVKADDINKAKAFAKDPGLKQAMQKGGVVGTPSFSFIRLVYQDTATIGTTIRSRTTFTVKDFENWRKVFESHRQTRTDNGLTDRAYGHDVDDDHNVFLVVAVNDTAKANAFWKSDLLKQQRRESGATSEPQRFLFRIVQRY